MEWIRNIVNVSPKITICVRSEVITGSNVHALSDDRQPIGKCTRRIRLILVEVVVYAIQQSREGACNSYLDLFGRAIRGRRYGSGPSR